MKDYKVNLALGLSNWEVQTRIENNKVNYDTILPSKSIIQIINSNIFTLFNLLNFSLAVAVLLVGSYKNVAFMGVVFCNTLIGIIQEINAKRIIDKLSLIASTQIRAIRNGKELSLFPNQIVLDDLIILTHGNQVICDSFILEGNCEVDESLITGESDPIFKKKGDRLLSGSFIVSGEVKVQVKHVGDDNYSAKITKEAKIINDKKSLLTISLNKIIKLISIIIIPLGIVLFLKQLSIDNNCFDKAVINTVAALIGMIPEGLILLTSTVLAVSVIRLARNRVLIQQLYSVETLARIDTICLDKTGTLTNGKMEFVKYIEINKKKEIKEIVSSLILNLETDKTIEALKKEYDLKVNWEVKGVIPFSSLRKWSGVSFLKKGTFIMGAPEFVFKDNYQIIKEIVNKYANQYRVLILAQSEESFKEQQLPQKIIPLGLFLFRDNIRKEATKTLTYFDSQGVDIKIISGDNVLTVVDIATRVGLKATNNYIDASLIKGDDELKDKTLKYDIFGRVSPLQKKKMVKILQEQNKTVGFVGDGVNDVLALKASDCGVAMASGSDAARNVSELILLDSNFDAMPYVVNEGRRTINNIERSATLFLVKTIYATAFALLFLFINSPYPFEPIQLSLTSVFTIGIPSFVLAIEPNWDPVRGNFFANVIGRALPTAITNIINVIIIMIIGFWFNLSFSETSTLTVILSAFVGFMLLYKISFPFNNVRLGLFGFCVSGFLTGVLGLPALFSLAKMNIKLWLSLGSLITISIFNFNYLTDLYYKFKNKYPKYFT